MNWNIPGKCPSTFCASSMRDEGARLIRLLALPCALALLVCAVPANTSEAGKSLNEQLRDAISHADIRRIHALLDRGCDVKALINGTTPLAYAVDKRHIDIVELLLDKGADINWQDSNGKTPLERVFLQLGGPIIMPLFSAPMAQCKISGFRPVKECKALDERSLGIVKLLLQRGADPNSKVEDGTILNWAAVQGQTDLLRLLLQKGADVHAERENGSNVLRWAAMNGNNDAVKLLKKHGASMTLHEAALIGDKDEVQRLLRSGADINARNQCGHSALMEASGSGRCETMKILIQKGAAVNLSAADGRTALMEATAGGKVAAARLLLKHGARVDAANECGWTPLIEAAWSGNIDLTKLLMANGARKNLMDNFGKTAFMKTVEMGHTTVARFFMENGAHPRTTNPDGWTAVMVAGGNEDLEMLRLLRDYGAEITLHFAAMIGDMVKAQELLASGVDINATDEFGRTPLMWAAAMRQSEMVKLLVDKGAKVNIRDPNGWTALMWAAKNSRIETLDFLLGKGADVNASAGNGWTALMWSVSNKQTEAVKLLLNRNADVEAADWKGMTALELAHETQKIREMLEARGAWKPPTDHGKRSNQCEAEWDFSSLEILTGSPAPRSPHQTIRMDSQEVIMRLGEKSFVIEGAYRFFNTGRTTTEWIAFPKKGNACRDGRLLNPAFMRFQVWIDGAKADFSEERGSFRMPTDLFPATKATHSQSVGKSIDNYDRWLGQMVTFPAQKGLTIRLRYEDRYVVHDAPPTLDAESPSSLDEATYIMGTGSFWRDRIRHSAFVVDASGVGGTKHLVGLPSRGLARMTDTLVRYEERDYEPESGSTISIGVRPPRVSESASKRRW